MDERIRMKTYKHLWEGYLSKENYDIAVHNACRRKSSKKHRKQSAWIKAHSDEQWPHFRSYAENFKNAPHRPIIIYDGVQRKKRTIIVPTMREQVVHHMVVNILKPIISHGMYEHSYGSIPYRGAHKGKITIEKWIRHDVRNVKYCLKMDIRKFFESIPHEILIRKIEGVIKDEKFVSVLKEIISVQTVGIPLGFYTSQWIANWYLEGLDHYIKETLGARHYIRYMDDMVVFGSNKRRLHEIREAVEKYVASELGLTLKDNWQVFRFDYIDKSGRHGRELDFMGFRFYRDRTILRRRIYYKLSRKAVRVNKKLIKTVYDCKQLLAYLGWVQCTDTYGAYLRRVKPNITFQYCKRRVSNYDRRKNKCGNMQNATTKKDRPKPNLITTPCSLEGTLNK